MSSAGNQLVSLTAPGPIAGTTPYDLQLAQAQRQQRLAQALQEQASAPIEVQSGGGAPAPISWASVLAKGLQGGLAGYAEKRANDQIKKAGVQDQSSAAALAAALTAPHDVQSLAPTAAPGQQQSIDIQQPQLPGGGAPPPPTQAVGQMPQPGVQQQTTQQAPTADQQLATLLAARGGPQTNDIRNAMLPAILQQKNAVFNQGLQQQNDVFKNNLPTSQGMLGQIAAQGQQTQQNARVANALPETAHDLATDAQARNTLAETHNYHQLMTGQGLTEDGNLNPNIVNFGTQIQRNNMTFQNVPKWAQPAVAKWLTDNDVHTALGTSRSALASNRIVGNLMKLPEYANTANGLQYLSRIAAARQNPGSVTDQELLDSLTKLNTAGNAITDAQVRIITDGKSASDWANIQLQKLKSGGVLSPDQRQQIQDVANRTYDNYKKSYQPIYDQAVKQLKGAGIDQNDWTIPDLNNLRTGMDHIGGGTTAPAAGPAAAAPQIAPAGMKASGPGGKIVTSDGKGGWN